MRSVWLGGLVFCAFVSGPRAARDRDLPSVRVISGDVAIARDAGGVIITQRSARAVVAWPRLAVDEGAVVRVLQPSRDAELELRSDGGAIIAGRLAANGAIAIADRAGVTVERGAVVDAANVSIAAARGDVVNDGSISAAAGGGVVCDGGRVVNRGRIRADRGHIFLHGDMRHGRVDAGGTLDASAANDGDGGFIDTTAAHVAVAGDLRVTTAAARGRTGTWRIDPNDYTVAAGGDITGANLSAALASTNVVIESSAGASSGSGNIFVNDPVSYSANQLTLTAANDIQVKAVITVGGSGTIALNPGTANGSDAASATGALLLRMTPAGFVGRIDFPGRVGAGFLHIGGSAYTVVGVGSQGSTSGTDLQGINGALGGLFALGGDVDASVTSTWNGGAGFQPIATFTGHFDGLGHVIKRLRINLPSADNVGLFGATSGATIANVGLLGGSVTGENNVGALVGSVDGGQVVNSFAATAVTGLQNVGGLVGTDLAGQLGMLFASGDVTGLTANSSNIGGLIGSDSGGVIATSFAGGRVDGAMQVGGFAGDAENDFISNCFSTGPVFASSAAAVAGAFLGFDVSPTIVSDYAAGYTRGIPGAGSLTGFSSDESAASYSGQFYCQADSTNQPDCTSDLHGALPGGFDGSVWGTGPGLLPYLSWFYPDGAQAVSGTVYLPTLVVAPGARAELWVNGVQAAVASTGATSTFGFAVPSGVLKSGSPLMMYASTDSASDFGSLGGIAGAKITRVGSDIGGNVLLGFVTDGVSAASTSWLPAADSSLRAAAIGDHSELAGYPRGISTSAASFTIDSANVAPGGFAVETRTQNADIRVTAAQSFTTGGLALFAAHDVSIEAAVAIGGSSRFGARSNGNATIVAATDRGAFRVAFKSDGTFAGRVDVDRTGHGILGIDGVDYNVINSLGAVGSTSGSDLQGMNGALGDSFALGADIDASPTSSWSGGFSPIGGSATSFSGNADGLGHFVTNLTFDCSVDCGLFGLAEGSVMWQRLANFGVVGGSVSGSIVGGLAGFAGNYQIINDYSTVSASGAEAGSLVGESDASLFTYSHASGAVNGSGSGGLVGATSGSVSMLRCYATGNVTGINGIGGLVGFNYTKSGQDSYDECYAGGNVTATVSSSGGDDVGGLLGSAVAAVHRSYAGGNVSGKDYVGGLVGTGASIYDSYATGSVTGTKTNIGGLVGSAASATLTNVFSTGHVSGPAGGQFIGGLVGNGTSTDATSAYWDTQTSGMSTSAVGMGEPTSSMYEQATYLMYDFSNTWFIAEGAHYPILRWQLPTCPSGYVLASDGATCGDVDECATANGGCAQTCTNTAGSYDCSCGTGYALDADLHGCDDVNECASGNGGCAQVCNNTVGSFNCSCSSGYTLNADGHSCDDVNECATANGGCAQICNNSAGGFTCACNGDYTLDADGRGCDAVMHPGADGGTASDGGSGVSDGGTSGAPDAATPTPTPTPHDAGTPSGPASGNGGTNSTGNQGGCSVVAGDPADVSVLSWAGALLFIALRRRRLS